LILIAVQISILWAPLGVAILAYLIWSVSKNFRYVNKIGAVFWLPVLQVTADLSVIFGTIVGFLAKAYGLL
jgi:hypothetical protein